MVEFVCFMVVTDNFDSGLDPYWAQYGTGGGTFTFLKSVFRVGYDYATADRYTDAEINDCRGLPISKYPWRAPLRMTVRARTSHKSGGLQGTAGFGFWNRPFINEGRWFTLPESVWFFYASHPSNMALVPGIPGWGWKAQVIHSFRPAAAFHALPLTAMIGYARLSGNTQPASHLMQRFVGAEETVLSSDMTKWHTYTLEWLRDRCVFWVDKKLVFQSSLSPSKNLCFVAWMDNWYAVATPKGEIRFGKCVSKSQWLDLDFVCIESL